MSDTKLVTHDLETMNLPGIQDLVEERIRLKAEEDRASEARKNIDKAIAEAFESAGIDTARLRDYTISRVVSRTASRVDRQLLYENGVSVDVIEKSTIPGGQYVKIQISRRKEHG